MAHTLEKKLERLGFVANVSIDFKEQTIHFDYATFRDMDSLKRELVNMGHVSQIPKKALTGKKNTVCC